MTLVLVRLLACRLLLVTDTVSFADEQKGSVAGVIRSNRGELLAGASIILKGTRYGGMADAGLFSLLHILVRSYKLAASFVGYRTLVQILAIQLAERLKTYLLPLHPGADRCRS
ncbi:MAG: carboxypeptidase-like regulatory domain-containing protein [Ferruginibacter sp.]|nr:carboxypeptidase-like regulatory domain-containing protein [Cytophagales bacterium]